MNIPFRSDAFKVTVELNEVTLPDLVGIFLYKERLRGSSVGMVQRDGLCCSDVPSVGLFTTVTSTNGVREDKEEIPHMVLASPGFGCYILIKDMQNMYQYLLLFQVGSYYSCHGMFQRTE